VIDSTCDNCQHWVPTLRSRTANICFVKTREHNPGLDLNDPKRLDVLTEPKASCDAFRGRA
jgi:hypothetical protein